MQNFLISRNGETLGFGVGLGLPGKVNFGKWSKKRREASCQKPQKPHVAGHSMEGASKSGPFEATFGRKRPLFRPNGPPGGKVGPPGQIPGATGRFPAENHGKGPAREMGRPERRGAAPRNVGPPRVMWGRPE